jgi:hypothetical protein
VVNASKFLYQFRTHAADRKYLGLLHPGTNLMYQYRGMPMGSGNSPALAGRYGTAFMCLLKRRCSLFQGSPSENTWRLAFQMENVYDGKVGQGLVYYGNDNLPVVLIWVHCDNFLIHEPTHHQ